MTAPTTSELGTCDAIRRVADLVHIASSSCAVHWCGTQAKESAVVAQSRFDELVDALMTAESAGETLATSVRIPKALHRAVALAAELGMDESFTAATNRALSERVRAFVRQRALAEHFAGYPADVPTLAAVARRRVQGSDHPGAARPDLIDAVAAWVSGRRPDWALTGAVDEAVDDVLAHVELLAAGVGRRRRSA